MIPSFTSTNAYRISEKALVSNWFIVIVAAITYLSWETNQLWMASVLLFGMACYIVLTQRNLLSLAPIMTMFTFSIHTTTFDGNLLMLAPVVLFLGVLTFRVLFSKKMFGKRYRASWFLISMLLLTISWALGGIFYRFPAAETSPYNILILLALGLSYCVIYVNMDNCIEYGWDIKPIEYFSKIMLAAAMVVTLEIFSCILSAQALYPDESIPHILSEYGKNVMFVGWGTPNNVAAVFTISIPLTLLLSTQNRWHSPIFFILALFQVAAAVLTMSRACILFIVILLPFELLYTIKVSERRFLTAALVIGVTTVFVVGIVSLWSQIELALQKMIDIKFDDNGRLEIYREAVRCFSENPLFGRGLDYHWGYGYGEDLTIDRNTGTPFYFHNTILQVLASLGLFGALIYSFNYVLRAQILFKYKTKYNTFAFFAMICFELSNLLDTNCFQVGLILVCFMCYLMTEKQNSFYPKIPPTFNFVDNISELEKVC